MHWRTILWSYHPVSESRSIDDQNPKQYGTANQYERPLHLLDNGSFKSSSIDSVVPSQPERDMTDKKTGNDQTPKNDDNQQSISPAARSSKDLAWYEKDTKVETRAKRRGSLLSGWFLVRVDNSFRNADKLINSKRFIQNRLGVQARLTSFDDRVPGVVTESGHQDHRYFG